MSSAPRRRDPGRRDAGVAFVRILLGVALAVQVTGAVIFIGRQIVRLPHEWQRFSIERVQPSPSDLDAEVFRFMGRFVAQIPSDARVLLISGVLRPLSYGFYLVPRESSFLFRFDPSIIEQVARMAPDRAPAAAVRFDYLEERGLRLTAERLVAALPPVSYVITHRFEWTEALGPDLASRGFEPIQKYGEIAVLWRRRREG